MRTIFRHDPSSDEDNCSNTSKTLEKLRLKKGIKRNEKNNAAGNFQNLNFSGNQSSSINFAQPRFVKHKHLTDCSL